MTELLDIPQVRRATVEECWILTGTHRGRVWLARRRRYASGRVASVAFDAAWALAREEDRGDVVGFLHTHPTMSTLPSRRDVRTIRAWCAAFGKPLLCIIAGSRGDVGAYRFANTRSRGRRLRAVELFPSDRVVIVE
jgi:proteasome lid subunit RPN8/RPN11